MRSCTAATKHTRLRHGEATDGHCRCNQTADFRHEGSRWSRAKWSGPLPGCPLVKVKSSQTCLHPPQKEAIPICTPTQAHGLEYVLSSSLYAASIQTTDSTMAFELSIHDASRAFDPQRRRNSFVTSLAHSRQSRHSRCK